MMPVPGTARLRGIWIKRAHRGAMDAVERATLVEGRGVLGSADQGGRRQVTILAAERWAEAAAAVGRPLDPGVRRANLLGEGLDLEGTRGRTLVVGACRLLIGGETRPCERMEEAHPGLERALDGRWAGGVHAQVLQGGAIAVGDEVHLAAPHAANHRASDGSGTPTTPGPTTGS
jgi:MOSC domain-containing protein YiiM